MDDEPPRHREGKTRNSTSAVVGGSIVQARDIHGDITLVDRSSSRVVPTQLPAHTSAFVGRTNELDWLDEHTTVDQGAVTITVLSGAAGIGKTALALSWAHRSKHRFPDGQLYIDLRGFGAQEPMTCSQALHSFLTSLGVGPEIVPTDPDARAGLYRSLMNERHLLVVLDNARDTEHVRPLLPGGPGCVVLVTSRNRLDSLGAREGAHSHSLGLLTADDSLALLERRVGRARVAEEPENAIELVGRCARLPLALSIAAARVANHPGARLAELVEELGDENGFLDALDLGEVDLDLRAVFSWSYRALASADQAAFRLLGLHLGPDISDLGAASLFGVPVQEARRRLGRLAAAHLVEEHVPRRFRMHDLLRLYAGEQADAGDNAGRTSALRRLFDHYVHSSWAAERLVYAYREVIELPSPAPGTAVAAPTSYQAAVAWFTAEHTVLLATVRQARDEGFHAHAWLLPWSLVTYFERHSHWMDNDQALSVALESAIEKGDQQTIGRTFRYLGRALTSLGRHQQAMMHYRRALEINEALDDIEGMARTHRGLSMLLQITKSYEEALAHAEIARTQFQKAGNRNGEARSLHTLVRCNAELGRYEEALTLGREAIRLFRELSIPDHQGEASAVDSLAFALHRLGYHREAITHYEQALVLWRQLGNQFYEAGTLTRLGGAHRSAGNAESARGAWLLAAEIYERLNHPDANVVRAELRA
ncbi:ATP-binding protein [Lentzea sp. NPDC051213]|uniref:ATP-binding protein n=1 Tax=Lentzea sp. NPDC051213 TaxID=3364126 RepID=UPI0037B59680